MFEFSTTRAQFALPSDLVYLDGNSLGPLPRNAEARLQQTLNAEWGPMLIRGWNDAGWMGLPERVGDRIAPLIGALPGTVTMGDTLSLKLFQALSAALELRPDRRVVLSDSGNFPSDLYMADALLKRLGGGAELRIVEPEQVADALDDSVAVLMLTEVDFRTGRRHDMRALTAAARGCGAVTVWDLAHSAGAFPIALDACGADFAVGCTYKYLNGGPGAPAFIYVNPAIIDQVTPLLAGWLGHASPFDFSRDYEPAPGIGRMRVGTPAVLALQVLDAALDIWDGVPLADVQAQSIALSELFIREVEARCPDLTLGSPRDPRQRGSQVSFHCEHGYPVMQALIANGVIGDFRAPDGMRFGFTPLYLSEQDVRKSVDVLAQILSSRSWDQPRFHARARVT
ncbi:MAG: kynureninase [Pseudomonadota bacterium]